MALSVLAVVLALLLVAAVHFGRKLGHRAANNPPGPPTLPFIGNAHLMLGGCFHQKCADWAKQYGPLLHLKLLTGDVLVINDYKTAKDLLDGRSRWFSSRPPSHVVQGLIAGGDHPLFTQMGPHLQKLRGIMARYFSEQVVRTDYLHVSNAEAVEVLYQILNDPKDWIAASKRFSNSVTTTLLYGIRGPVYKSWACSGIFDIMDRWGEILDLGAVPPVDIWPVLQKFPERIAPWKTEAHILHKLMNGLYMGLLNQCKTRFNSGIRRPCLVDKLIEDQATGELDLTDHQLPFLLGVQLEGGSDTTAGTIITFILLIIYAPDVQRRAQEEMDKVCGEGRTPVIEDADNLPYMRALQKEVMRFRPVLPIAVPHYLERDEEYNGMHLPGNSTVIQNTWAINNDSAKWTDPEKFNPERFLGYDGWAHSFATKNDPFARDHYAFGSGRRLCPGIHLADRNLFLEMAKLLWAFEFKSPIDPATGQPFPVNVQFDDPKVFTKGIIPRPHPFPLDVAVRSEKRAQTIRHERAYAVEHVFSRFPDHQEPTWWAKLQETIPAKVY